MQTVNVTELRAHLPNYLNMVQMGEEIAIANRGKMVARLVPDEQVSKQQAAQARLDAVKGKMIVGDIMSPSNEVWTGDEDNL
jgi:prevent-host-death family protein